MSLRLRVLHMQHGAAKSSVFCQGYENLLEATRKARRLNNHVFLTLRARCPLEDKVACAIKQSRARIVLSLHSRHCRRKVTEKQNF